METLYERKIARAKGGQGGIPKYGEISIPIKNVSIPLGWIKVMLLINFHPPAFPTTHH